MRNPILAAARVLDVGNCDPDQAGIREMIECRFDAADPPAVRRKSSVGPL